MKNYVVEPGKTWKIGDVTIHFIFEQWIEFDENLQKWILPAADMSDSRIDWCIPDFVTKDRHLIFSVKEWLLQINGKNILIDTGLNAEDGNLMLRGLSEHGVAPEDVDYVLFTHLHNDHCSGNIRIGLYGNPQPTFPNARYIFVRENYEHHKAIYENESLRRGDPSYDLLWQYLFQMKFLVDAGMVDFVDADYVFCDEIKFVPTPGHDVGMVGFLIESKGESAFIGSDFLHHPVQMVQLDVNAGIDHDAEVSVETRKKILDWLADTDTLFFASHAAGDHAYFVTKAEDDTFKLVKSR